MGSLSVIYTRQATLSSLLIRAGSWWGPWSHCGVVDDRSLNPVVIESLAKQGGVVVSPILDVLSRSSEWEIVRFECPNPEAGLDFAYSTVGCKYDWSGVFGIPFRGRDWENSNRWYCSENVETTLAFAGLDRWRPGMKGVHPCQSYFNKS